MLDAETHRELAAFLCGRVCIVGVGNRNRGDDGAGPSLIDARCEAGSGVWLDVGMTLENHLATIAGSHPDSVLIVDVIAFGGVPGECRLMDAESLDTVVLSTHAGSLGLLSEYLAARTGAHVRVMAIQPQSIEARDGLSHPVAASVRELSAILSELLV